MPSERIEPFVTRGVLGWGNRKNGVEPYGPGGRWAHPRLPARPQSGSDYGDLLGDHLADLGAKEGARLIVVVVPSHFADERIDAIAEAIEAAVSDA